MNERARSDPGLICLIALERPVELDPRAMLDALEKTAPLSDVMVTARDPGGGGSGLAVRIDGRDYAAVAFGAQMPDDICAMALAGGTFWPDRHEAIASHGGFVALAADEPAKGHGLVRAQAVALTRMAAAVAGYAPALGVIWPAAGIAFPAARLGKAIDKIQHGAWPVDLWIGFELIATGMGAARRTGARSRGARIFFGAEIEIKPQPDTGPAEPLRMALNLAAHLMVHGPHLREGQTMQLGGGRPMRIALHPARDGRPAILRLAPDTAAAV